MLNARIVFEAIALVCIMIIMFTLGLAFERLTLSVSYTCTFDNIIGEYTATEEELNDHGSMVTVTKDNRTFMFERYKLDVCTSNGL